MAGLVGYASSDEESDGQEETQAQTQPQNLKSAGKPVHNGITTTKDIEQPRVVAAAQLGAEPPTDAPRIAEASLPVPATEPMEEDEPLAPAPPPASVRDAPPTEVLIGPSRPPGIGGAAAAEPAAAAASLPPLDDEYEDDDDGGDGGDGNGDPPLSPYSAERAAVRQLTLPRVPDFDIPGSPQGRTPPPTLAALNKKFATFLELKQKKNTHFNARLAQSDAMKNPALMDKLMAFVGLEPNAWGGAGGGDGDDAGDDGTGRSRNAKTNADKPVDTSVVAAQYATTLPTELWDPAALPAEAYRRSLRRLQEEAARQRARGPGERVEFVAASASTPSGGTPSGGGGGGRDGSSERTSRAGTPLGKAGAPTGKRKTRFD